MRGQIGVPDRRLITLAKDDATCRLLMTCPGVGIIVAASFAAAIEAPEHFRHSRSVGADLGLTPARHQSGEIDRTGGLSRGDDRLTSPGAWQRPPRRCQPRHGQRWRGLGQRQWGAR
ncbi:IS110 family transposase [Amaricoccus solimangrovi]|uniref:IS110 family transposase n=1 Tax=Amaricoccus solimangrovi TaxID=2589815 RepID=A0A501WRK0_9RHOB|nr:IS110 family transposase [Amaricoccus solimangrovi]